MIPAYKTSTHNAQTQVQNVASQLYLFRASCFSTSSLYKYTQTQLKLYVNLANEADHEEDTKKEHHSQRICEHHVAGERAHKPVKAEAKLMREEQDGPEHEEPAAHGQLMASQAQQQQQRATWDEAQTRTDAALQKHLQQTANAVSHRAPRHITVHSMVTNIRG